LLFRADFEVVVLLLVKAIESTSLLAIEAHNIRCFTDNIVSLVYCCRLPWTAFEFWTQW